MGAEEVGNAGRSIREAAQQMQRAAECIEASLEIQRRFMDDWLLRFEQALQDDDAARGKGRK